MVRPRRDRISGPVEVDETYVGGLEVTIRHTGLIGHAMLHSTRVAIFFFGRDRVA